MSLNPEEPQFQCLRGRVPVSPPARSRSQLESSKIASDAEMPFIEHVSDADLERLALERVVPSLLSYGFSYVDGFLGEVAGGAVLEQDGRLAGSVPDIHRRSIRGDKIAWVSGSERGCEAISFLLNLIDKLISVCASRLGTKAIRERSKAMVACYPGNGAGYVKHVDNPNCDGRCITCIYYLNKNWNSTEHGGVLRIFPEGKNYPLKSQPPPFHDWYAITVWYFDSEERAEAKRRFRDLTASTGQQGSSSG
ncbi:hypothetical protein INR49_007017 [Caranx melampygus]|nr:hypothetical protein INR49_007017 [Caranx melampygus]